MIRYVFSFHSQFIYELARAASTAPVPALVKEWVKKISVKIGVTVKYTNRLHTMLVRRANYVRQHFKKLKGGAPQRRFLSNQWTLSLEHSEVDLLTTIEKVRELQEDVTILAEQKAEMEHQVQQVISTNEELCVQTRSLQSEVQTLTSKVLVLGEKTKRLTSEKDIAEASVCQLSETLRQATSGTF